MKKEVINLIVLDIDGVLNSPESNVFYFGYNSQNYAEYLHKRSPYENDINLKDIKFLCPRACSNLTQLLLSIPNCRILLSSTWKKNHSIDYMNKLFYTMGITQRQPCIKCQGEGLSYISDGNGGIKENGHCGKCKGLKTHSTNINKNIIIDKTPILEQEHRGKEIESWIKNQDSYEINNFVIFDDSLDLEPYNKSNNFIHINDNLGLTLSDIDKAKQIFQK